MENKKAELEMLQRQLDRLQRNFTKMVQDSEEADLMLDWINEIRRRIEELKRN